MKGLKVLGLVIGMGLLILPVWANLDLDEYEQQKEAFGESYTEAVDQSSTSSTSSSSAILVQSVPRQGSSTPKEPKLNCSSKPLEIMGFNARSTKSEVERQLTAWGISYEEGRIKGNPADIYFYREGHPYGLPDSAWKNTMDFLQGGSHLRCVYVEYEGVVWEDVVFYFDRLGRLITVSFSVNGLTKASCQPILNTCQRITQAYPVRKRDVGDSSICIRKGGCNNLEWIEITTIIPGFLDFSFDFFRSA